MQAHQIYLNLLKIDGENIKCNYNHFFIDFACAFYVDAS